MFRAVDEIGATLNTALVVMLTRPAAVAVIPGQPWPVMTPPASPSRAIFGTSSKGNSARSQ